MKKIIFSLIIVMAVSSIIANPPSNRCCVATGGNQNTGICFAVYDADGRISKYDCIDPGAGSTTPRDCIPCND